MIKYGNSDAVERALHARRDRHRSPRSSRAAFARLGKTKNIKAIQRAVAVVHRSSRSTSARKKNCPDAKFNPAVQDVTVRQAIAYAIDRDRINEIATRGTSFIGPRAAAQLLQGLLHQARAGLPARRRQGQPDARRGRLEAGRRRHPRQGRPEALVQPVRALGVAATTSRTRGSSREMTKPIGVDFKVQIVSVDKLTEITTQKVRAARWRRTSTRSSGAGAATRTTRACCSTC